MSNTKKITDYLASLLLLILILSSNFINKDLFSGQQSNYNFAVWFILSLFCFCCGYFINKILGWNWGGKVLFAIAISSIFLSVVFLTIFRDLFDSKTPLIENLILYSLRNITLGAIALFGLAIAEVFRLEKVNVVAQEKLELFESRFKEANKEAELVIKEAELKAQSIIQDAELDMKDLSLTKVKLEKELKEFIQAEKELLKKYEGNK